MARALIAEDNNINALLIRDVCKDMDFEPMAVEDGQAAVDAVRESAPDVILLDIGAPVVDGLSATIQIRGLRNVNERMMIIGLNSDSETTSAACRIAGMNHILATPLKPERLMAALRAARAPLNLQAAVSEAEQGHEEPETEPVLLQRVADLFGAIPPQTPCARLHFINAPKLKPQFGEDWADVAATIEMIARAQIEQVFGADTPCKKFDGLDFLLVAPGMDEAACIEKCQAAAKQICLALAEDEAGAKFHIRTFVFLGQLSVAAPALAVSEAPVQRDNPDILPWTKLIFWPVWDVPKRKFPIHSVRVDRDKDGAYLPEAQAAQGTGLEPYYEALDLSAVAALVERLDGYETLEQPRLLTLPVHLHTLGAPVALTHYLRYLEKIPKKIRERLIVELHDVPPDMRAGQIVELQKPILPHCLHTMLVVPPSYAQLNVLRQVSGQIVGLKLPEGELDILALKLFGQRAKQAGLNLVASMVCHTGQRDWGLASCQYVLGPAIALPQMALGPHAKFIP